MPAITTNVYFERQGYAVVPADDRAALDELRRHSAKRFTQDSTHTRRQSAGVRTQTNSLGAGVCPPCQDRDDLHPNRIESWHQYAIRRCYETS